MYFEFHQLPDHVQSLITDFVDLNAFSSGENREYYRGGYELIRYAMPNEELVDKEENLNMILRQRLSPDDYIDLGRYA